MSDALDKKLVGYEVRLDPSKSGMLYDAGNDFNFNFFDKDKPQDRMEITEKTDLSCIRRNIKQGTLRVFTKDNKDVTMKFGGPPSRRRPKPIVKKGMPELDRASDKTLSVVKILDQNDLAEIEKYVNNIGDYSTLEDLLELEKQGHNPTSHSRAPVLDIIGNRMKHVSGISVKDKPEDTEELTMK